MTEYDWDQPTRDETRYDEETLSKVYRALVQVAGLTYAQAEDAVNAMQSEGILFRERT